MWWWGRWGFPWWGFFGLGFPWWGFRRRWWW